MAKARKILSNTISELLKETSLETRIKMSCWFTINNVIHELGAREELVWDETNPRDIELMKLLDDKTKELTDKILNNIKEWEEDGKPI
jgi:SOS-response transcriptional repressor LexA